MSAGVSPFLETARAHMRQACLLCDLSSCGYKVGCVIALDAEVLATGFNGLVEGNVFCQDGTCVRKELNLAGGKDIHKVCSIHAEAQAIGHAARGGIKLKGAQLYVTTFPCVVCARLIAVAGIAKVYYMTPYMGADFSTPIFEANSVELQCILEPEVWKEQKND